MSEEPTELPQTLHELTEQSREKLEDAKRGVGDVLASATDYVRANPWIALAGAVVIGGVIATLARPKPEPRGIDALRELLEEGLAKLPTQKQVEAAAESTGVPCFLKRLANFLRLP